MGGHSFLEKERILDKVLLKQFLSDDQFYVIGHYEENDLPQWDKEEDFYSVIAHEVAHGLFYLNNKYKKEALVLIRELPEKVRDKISRKLLKSGGYCKAVLKDETQAYLATSELAKFEEFGIGWKHGKKFRELFKRTVKG